MDWDVTIIHRGYVLPAFCDRRKEGVVMQFSGMGYSPNMSLEDYGFLLDGYGIVRMHKRVFAVQLL